MNLSFAGCGFLGIYHVGVAGCFKKYAPHLLLDKISGASAGAIAACCLLCDLPLGEMTSNVLRLAREARQRALGPFSPSFDVQEILLESLQKFLPDDAHVRVSGKLHISLTRVYDGKNVIVSQFTSREDLLQALLASSFIPLFTGLLPPRFHGIRYMDGGFSDNLPTLDENTITVSPFCGESDICPRDVSSQLFHVNLANTSIELSKQNIYRFARILFPPNPEILSNMCKQGFDDALRFLQRNNLINCTRCLAVQSTFVVSGIDGDMDYDPECSECKMHRQEALVANLPEAIMNIFQDAIDSANKGLVNWLFKHKSMKLLSLLSIPYTVPADVFFATLNKLIMNYPKLQKRVKEFLRYILEQLGCLLPKINIYYQPMSQIIQYQLNFTQFDPVKYDDSSLDTVDSVFKKSDVNLTLHYNDLQSWSDHGQAPTNCVIDIPDLSTMEDTFENILKVPPDQEALMTYYYMDENNKVQLTEIYDVTDTNKRADLSTSDSSGDIKMQFDEWDEPTWLSHHTITDVHEKSQNTILNLGELSDISMEDDGTEGSNIFSDTESDYGMKSQNETQNVSLGQPDCRPEVDQPNQ